MERRQFDITDAVDKFAATAKERGLTLSSEWRKEVIKRLNAYAKTINPFTKYRKWMFGAMQDRRDSHAVFMYGVNPNAKYDQECIKPPEGRVNTTPYHVNVKGFGIYKPGWKTLKTAQIHTKDIGQVVEYGLNNYFTYNDFVYGISAAGNAEWVHSTKNIAEMIFNSDAIDRILLEAAEDVTK